jgi:two-component system phosphate regulon sensor histidine kinase PhoR
MPLSAGLWKDVFREVTRQQTAGREREHRLSRNLNRFRDAVSVLPDAVVILGHAGTIDWINPAAATLLGIDPGVSGGHKFRDLVRDPVLVEYLAGMAFERPLIVTAPANKAKILSFYVTFLDRDQQLQMIVARDITRQYHLDTAQQDFVANVSHELRTPLTVITGLLEQMNMDGIAVPARRRVTELMQKQAARMAELITDLLTLSHLELNEQPPGENQVPVPELLLAIVEEAHTLGDATNHVIQPEIQSVAGLCGDRKELRTAFSNLVTNAIRHTPERTEVRIRWWIDNNGGHFGVSDNGEGIAARHLPRLTERLYRVDTSRSRETGGTGLGLAIVKQVLDRHQAVLEITSQVGRGSNFICHFPARSVITPDMMQNL